MVVMFKVEKHSLAIQHFPDVRQIENGLAFLQNMTSGDYLPNSETLCLWEIYFQLWQGSCWLRKFMMDLCLKILLSIGFRWAIANWQTVLQKRFWDCRVHLAIIPVNKVMNPIGFCICSMQKNYQTLLFLPKL